MSDSGSGAAKTIRALIERIRERAVCRYPSVACDRESLTYHQLCAGCADHADAVAALALLDEAPRKTYYDHALGDVPGPNRIVRDPAPRGDDA